MKNKMMLMLFFLFFFSSQAYLQEKPIEISGIYPHLAVFNPMDKNPPGGGECGIGAIVPWNKKLYMVTYSPHEPKGSADRLWVIDENLNIMAHEASIGGTPANRMIHRESQQLIIGPHFIDKNDKVRTIPYGRMPGRHTATSRHLFDPENKVYFYEMEGSIYEVNVNNLQVKLLFKKPVPGWHGKGAYTGQERYIISNNGEHKVFDIDKALLQAGTAPRHKDEMGCLAEWDGKEWRIIERKQFTDVTGPGGIYGNKRETDPVWSIGWDRRSVLLKLLDKGKWYTFRLPKATNTYDHWGGWYTEWPRIREVTNGKWLMDMHGMFYDFPPDFSIQNTGGLKPVSSHLRYIPDFCQWNGQLLLAADDVSLLENPMAGRSQSNLWFGKWDDLKKWGPKNGYGGPWSNDTVKQNKASDPFLIQGFDRAVLHLSHNQKKTVSFTLEVDENGSNSWKKLHTINVKQGEYKYYLLPANNNAAWIRIISDSNCLATAMFHLSEKAYAPSQPEMFKGIAGIEDKGELIYGMIRPAGHNRNLQFLQLKNGKEKYWEVNQKMNFISTENRADEVKKYCDFHVDFLVDEASVIVERDDVRVRLPKSHPEYDTEYTDYWPRGIREIQSERYMMNIHGSFYELPREAGLMALRPVCTHNKKIMDFCNWRGLLVLSGISDNASKSKHVFKAENSNAALWFGMVDDLWKLGKPSGYGGPWKNTKVKAGIPSDPYLMTNYDKKSLRIKTNKAARIRIEIDVDHNGWHTFKTITTQAGQAFSFEFPEGFNAHWIRFVSDKDCTATALLNYE